MKKIIQWLMLTALFGAAPAFAGGSNPGLYYGQIPTAAQWNSYFSAKLDYTPGAVNTIPFWDGSGSQLNALVSGDCTSAANVFTCTHATSANNIVGGTQWGVLYQSAVGATTSTAAGASGEVLTSNGTSAPTFQTIGSPFAAAIHAATNKSTPVDADEFGIWNSVDGLLNKITWANLKTTLGSTFADLAGSASQVFSVAPATAAAHAVRSDQISADNTSFPTYYPLTSFATVLSSGTGSFTTASATMYILRIGKKVTAFFSATIITNGTAATSVKMSIPNAASSSVSASGTYRENAVTGASGQAFISAGSSTIELTTHTNTYPGADGYVLVGEVTYVEE